MMRFAHLRPVIAITAALVLYPSLTASADAACSVFPRSNPWNTRIDRLPVALNSAQLIDSIGAADGLHPDFGSGLWEGAPIGIPVTPVSAHPAYKKVTFEYADESDRGPYPIPRSPRIEGGNSGDGDRHIILHDKRRCKLYELFAARKSGNRWRAGSGAIWNLRSNKLRPEGWTSADAAGLPILPGLARYSEVKRGAILHALRFTVSRTRRNFIWPARHFASSLTNPDLPAMGQRLRLKSGFDTSGFPAQARVILTALKRYGMIVADNGSDWFISGEPSPSWDNDKLRRLKDVKGSDFEVVDTTSTGP